MSSPDDTSDREDAFNRNAEQQSKDASKNSGIAAPSSDTPKDPSTKSANAATAVKEASKNPSNNTKASPDATKGILKKESNKFPISSKDAPKGQATSRVKFKEPEQTTKRIGGNELKLMTIKGALVAETPKQRKAGDRVAVPTLLQPFCPRELLLSKVCTSELIFNNSLKGKIVFIIVLATIIGCLIGHAIALPFLTRRSYWNYLSSLQTYEFPHIRTPCTVIRNLDTDTQNLTFHDLPYATFSHRFEDSHVVDNFQDCYLNYYRQSSKELVSFEHGAFIWDYEVMSRRLSDSTAWRLQPKQPQNVTVMTGTSERLSLSILTPGLKGSRPVIVLVTGHDFTFNKPVLPSPITAWSLNCVLVTVNYRLGLDGAAILYRENYKGNLFARDVTQALIWLNRTVNSFGGDAGKIMYFGEGSGATMGLWLMLAPEAVLINRFWLMDPSVEIPALPDIGSMIEDVFLEEPSPLAPRFNHVEITDCYTKFKHRQAVSCLDDISLVEVYRITPKWMTEIYKYLDEFPEKATRKIRERSLLHLPPTMQNKSLLSYLRDKELKLTTDRPVVFHSSSLSEFYWSLFPNGRRNESRFSLETALARSLERSYIQRNGRHIGSAIVQHYVNMKKSEINEDVIDYEDVRRLLQHDLRITCPVQALIYHLLIQQVIKEPVYNLIDVSIYQSIPILVGNTDMRCNLPRFMLQNFDGSARDACHLAYDVGPDGRRRLSEYREAAIGILGDFAHGRTQAEHHPLHMVAAVGSAGGEGFDSSTNMLDHRGNMPGMDTTRSQLIKSVCHELYGDVRNDWNALLYMAKYN